MLLRNFIINDCRVTENQNYSEREQTKMNKCIMFSPSNNRLQPTNPYGFKLRSFIKSNNRLISSKRCFFETVAIIKL